MFDLQAFSATVHEVTRIAEHEEEETWRWRDIERWRKPLSHFRTFSIAHLRASVSGMPLRLAIARGSSLLAVGSGEVIHT